MRLEFSRQIYENHQISNFMKIHLVGAELFHADRERQTDRNEDVNSRFSKYRERC